MEVVAVIAAYSMLHQVLSIIVPDNKGRVWLSLINAAILSGLSAKTCYYVYVYGYNVSPYLLEKPQNTQLANYVMGFFTVDLLLGHIYDRANVGILTGYVHHSVYIALVYYLKTVGHSNLIYMCLPFEIPTALLDMNRLDKQKRFNLPFGISFIFCRLLYNMYIITAVMQINYGYSFIASLMLTMHMYWFYTWSNKYLALPLYTTV